MANFDESIEKLTHIIFLEESRMLESILRGEDDVLKEFAVGQGLGVVMILRQTFKMLSVHAARVDPLRLGLVDVFDVVVGHRLCDDIF